MLKLYNNSTKKKEEIKTLKENEISMYVCGPTLYGDIHIGNARPIIFFDVLYRFFKAQGIEVTYASNITDIDDKIINKAIEEGKTEKQIVEENFDKFEKVLKQLNVLQVDYRPTVTQYIQKIIDFIQELIEKDYAYKANNGDVYFRNNKIKDYGKISNRNIEELIAGSRVEVNPAKENELDFVLWKNTTKGITWNTPFGEGRPGWHTECVVMIRSIFGEQIDIHGGGMDLKFPHHENENAQNCATSNKDLANYWIHNGFVNINNEKMSKSLNNFITVEELLKQYNPNIIRLLLLQTNYRQPINLNEQFINQTIKLFDKINNFTNEITVTEYQKYKNENLSQDIVIEMEDDINTPNVITNILSLIKNKNKKDFITATELLGLKLSYVLEENDLEVDIIDLYKKAILHLEKKDYDKFDQTKEQVAKSTKYQLTKTRQGLIVKER